MSIGTKLHKLEGQAFEDAFMSEITYFTDSKRGVPGRDVSAALILRDAGRFEMLSLLHQRKIHVIGEPEDDDEIQDLEFEAI